MDSQIIVSLSGGKDSVAALLELVEIFGPDQLIAHHQVLPEDWPETVPYVIKLCEHLKVPLACQQVIYQPVGKGTPVKRKEIRNVFGPEDITYWDEGEIAGVTDLAMRRSWPPSPAIRYCTTYFKIQLLNTWLTIYQKHELPVDQFLIVLGERAAESHARARKGMLSLRAKCQRKAYQVLNWLPIQGWSRRQTFRKLHDYGVEPHPCYEQQGMTDKDMYDYDHEGGPRTSCRFCIYATHADCCHQAQILGNWGLRRRIEQVEGETLKTWWMNRSIMEYGG